MVRRPGETVKSLDEVLALDEEGRRGFLLGAAEEAFLAPVVFDEDPASLAPIDPPNRWSTITSGSGPRGISDRSSGSLWKVSTGEPIPMPEWEPNTLRCC